MMRITIRLIFLTPLLLAGCSAASIDIAQLKAEVERNQNTAENALMQAKFAKMASDKMLEANLAETKSENDTDETSAMTTREIALKALEEARAARIESEKAAERTERMLNKALSR